MKHSDRPPSQVGIQSSGGEIKFGDHNTINIAGHDLNFGAVQSRQELISQLEKLRDALSQTSGIQALGEETAIDAEAEVKKALGQAKKPTPNKKSILEYLMTAKSLIEDVAGASGLVTSLASAIEAVHKLFS